MTVIISPIKSQGIKTKLVPWINELVLSAKIDKNMSWIEPFFGTGVVGFNSIFNGSHIVGDTNPHIINFYKAIQNGTLTAVSMRKYLEKESVLLNNDGYDHFLKVRERFNNEYGIYDFIFLSRSGFNGMMRFNSKGKWNVPFCKKPNRFSSAYITKICNQIENVRNIISNKNWQFYNLPFNDLIEHSNSKDIIYCDPPYYGRYSDYFNSWTEDDEENLYELLKSTSAKFILSTWHHNDYRENEMLKRYWNKFNIVTKEHFYHNGGKIENRHAMVEALVFNFDIKKVFL